MKNLLNHRSAPATTEHKESDDTRHNDYIPSAYSPLREKDHRIIYLLTDDTISFDVISSRIEQFGYEVREIKIQNEELSDLDLNKPCAIIAELSLADHMMVKQSIKAGTPVIYISDQDTIDIRLRSVRAGGSYFLPLPFDLINLSNTIDKATTPRLSQSYKILIIDDDEMLAAFHELILKKSGMITQKLTDPLLALELLNKFKPDLILMDLYMPSCSGAELARVIRQKEEYSGIPIVFLSTESNVQEQMIAMEFGGDDFLSKPVQPGRLVAAVSTRAKRTIDNNTTAMNLQTVADELKNKSIDLDNALISARSSEALKSRLIATMSHEIRTPINGILGILGRMLQTNLDSDQKEQAEIVISSTQSLLSILNDTLDLSKLDAGKMILECIEFNLHKSINEVQNLFQDTAASKGLILQTVIDDQIPAVLYGDAVRLKQILINLVNNAIKFTESGAITLKVKIKSSDSDLVSLLFMVDDNGIGMNQEQQRNIFDEYTQAELSTSRTHGGTGLGLSICKKLTTMMDGEIGVSSEPGNGSTFWFTVNFKLNADISESIGSTDESEGIPDYSALKPYALIAEDNKVNQMIITSHLKKNGFTVDTADNGRLAYQLFSDNKYHLIFMDCNMPITDGYTATEMIRSSEKNKGTARTPIIAMTGNVLEGDQEKCLDAGMDDYLSKPIQKDALGRILKKWLAVSI